MKSIMKKVLTGTCLSLMLFAAAGTVTAYACTDCGSNGPCISDAADETSDDDSITGGGVNETKAY